MKTNRIGKSDLYATEISMGGSVPTTHSYGSTEFQAEFREALRAAFDSGITLFDSAEAYGDGLSETLLASELGAGRSRVHIASKVSYEHTSSAAIRDACTQSLRRLNTDYIDLYYVHFPNPKVPLSETIGTMMELKREGKIRAIGVSNFSLPQLREACEYGEIDAVQTCYSLLWRKYVERHLQRYCAEEGISLIASSPLASGLLSGKYRGESCFVDGDQRARSGNNGLLLYQTDWWSKALQTVERLKPIASRREKSVAQLAIKWLTTREAVTSVTAGAKNGQQMEQNIRSSNLELNEQELAEISDISSSFTDQLPEYLHYFLKMVPEYQEKNA